MVNLVEIFQYMLIMQFVERKICIQLDRNAKKIIGGLRSLDFTVCVYVDHSVEPADREVHWQTEV